MHNPRGDSTMAEDNTSAESWDVIIVGAGNAATCAALSAKEQGARVIMIEKAPFEERGGNSLFTAGGFRFVHDVLDDLRTAILDALTEGEVASIGNPPPHSKQKYVDDIMRVTENHADEDLVEILAGQSRDTMRWMRKKKISFL